MPEVQLHCGDCLDILPTLGKVDAVVTDAPYGLGYDASRSTQQGIQRFGKIAGDDGPFDVTPFLGFPDILAWCRPQLTTGVPIGLGAWYAWDKVTKNGLKVRIAECEYAWHKKATKTRAFRHLWSGAYRASEAGQKAIHPTQKPIALMRWCLELMGLKPGSTILDPYMGSGTTGVAAVELGFNFVGIELDPQHFATAQRRISAATHPTATLTTV